MLVVPPGAKEPPRGGQLPPPKPVLPKPKATHHFEIDPDSDIVGYVQKTPVGKDDTLPDIARRFDVGYEEMLTANPGVDPWLPGAGARGRGAHPIHSAGGAARRRRGKRGRDANLLLSAHKKGEPRRYIPIPSASAKWAGRPPRAPPRSSAARRILCGWCRSPCVKNTGGWRAAAGEGARRPDNPLGQYMFRLGWPSYLIHGTNKPYGVGMRSSHGCMRLYPEDIAVFFDLIPIGTKVTVVNQPYVFGWRDGTLYLQAYAVMEDDSRNWTKDRKRLLAKLLHPQQREQDRAAR